MADYLLEVCVDSPGGLLAAIRGGADRIELCAGLALSGLTPSTGLMRLAATQAAPSYAMIRPRPGDFCFGAVELDVMRGEIDAAREAGLPGVVLGVSRPSGELEADALGKLVEHAKGLGCSLHRAFDLSPDLKAALETAVQLGFERVLTSGGTRNAPAGMERLRDLVVQADGRIGILAGVGLSSANVAEVAEATGVRELHGSFKRPFPQAGANPHTEVLGFIKPELDETDEAEVAAAVAALKAQSR